MENAMFQLIDQFCKWLQETPFSVAIASAPWIIPFLQTIHILAIALVISAVFLLHLRLLGIIKGEQSPAAVAQRFLPFIWGPLPVLLVTGAILIIAEPARSLENPSFGIKMLLLASGLAVTLIYQRKLAAGPDYWQATGARRFSIKIIALLSLALWSGIVLAGRWIAYTQP
jgi:hypothetical protein